MMVVPRGDGGQMPGSPFPVVGEGRRTSRTPRGDCAGPQVKNALHASPPTLEMSNQGPSAKSTLFLTSWGLKLVGQEASGVLSTPHPLDNGQDLESSGRGEGSYF